jgi:hypothetical protein
MPAPTARLEPQLEETNEAALIPLPVTGKFILVSVQVKLILARRWRRSRN